MKFFDTFAEEEDSEGNVVNSSDEDESELDEYELVMLPFSL